MAFLGMMVQELGITFPGSMTLYGSVQFSDILKDGMGFAALQRAHVRPRQILLGGIAETVAMPASQYTGGPQNLPGGYDGSAGTIPGGYPFTEQMRTPRAHGVTQPERPRGHARHVRRHVPLVRLPVRPPAFPITLAGGPTVSVPPAPQGKQPVVAPRWMMPIVPASGFVFRRVTA